MQSAIGFPIAVLAGGLLLSSQMSSAKPEYTRKTKLECEKCHPPDSRTLNDAGEYYRTHHYKMDGYKPKDAGKDDAAGKGDKKPDKAQSKT